MDVTHSRCPGIFVDTFGKATRSTNVFTFFPFSFRIYLFIWNYLREASDLRKAHFQQATPDH